MMLIMGNKKGELKSNYLIIRVRVSEVGSKQPSPPLENLTMQVS